MKNLKLQSAMEYLMTYGWAILIIGVVLGGLVSLGIFSGNTLTPKATAGSCSVDRPNGPATSTFLTLQGVCNDELPQYVAQFTGATTYISLGNSTLLSPEAGANGQMTLCVWYYVNSLSNYKGPLYKGESYGSNGNGYEYTLDQQGNSQGFAVWTAAVGDNIANYYGPLPIVKTWYFSCFTYNYAASSAYYYVNGVQHGATFSNANGPATASTGNVVIGSGEGSIGTSSVYMADLQIYNTSLSANDITTLYDEGIGGSPIALPWLVGWWPLNGNPNDYSGDNFNGYGSNIIYTDAWASKYVSPP